MMHFPSAYYITKQKKSYNLEIQTLKFIQLCPISRKSFFNL
uniref:Uncharacterized protein n=1 Tax=Anguilla anguilla TaxID=7936 RepID=A0A0E9W5X6_ANGAN